MAYQTKIGNYIPTDHFKPVQSSQFFDELKLQGLLEIVTIPENKRRKHPPVAHLGFLVLKKIKGFMTDRETLTFLEKNPEWYQKLGYTKKPSWMNISSFRNKNLSKKGEEEFLQLVDLYIKDKDYFITDNLKNKLSEKVTDPIKLLSTKQKRKLITSMRDFLLGLQKRRKVSQNVCYSDKDIVRALSVLVTEGITPNGFSQSKRFEYEAYQRGKNPTGKTLLNWITDNFKNREEVRDFMHSTVGKIFHYITVNCPEISRFRGVTIAFDHHEIPTWESITRQQNKRKLTNPTDLIACAKDKSRGTILFRKFLTCSIVIKGHRFCLSYEAIDQTTNAFVEKQVDGMITRIKQFVPIRLALLDRGFDIADVHHVLQKRGIKYLMPKCMRSKKLKEWKKKAEHSKGFFHRYKDIQTRTNFSVETNVFYIRTKNKYWKKENHEDADKEYVVHAFVTNIKTKTKSAALALIESYRLRWGIEVFYKDVKYYSVKTTSNNSIIRDFFFANTITIFNLWILCNLVLFVICLNKEPGAPLIRFTTFSQNLHGFSHVKDPPS